MQSHIGCICLAFLYCVSSDGPSKNAPLNTCYHLFCNCNSLNHICSEQRLRVLIRCAFSEFVCTVFQTLFTRKRRMRFQFCTILCEKFTTSPLPTNVTSVIWPFLPKMNLFEMCVHVGLKRARKVAFRAFYS